MNRASYDRVMHAQTGRSRPSTPLADRVERAASVARCLVAMVDDLAGHEQRYTMLDVLHVADLLTDELADLHVDVHKFEFPIVCAKAEVKP